MKSTRFGVANGLTYLTAIVAAIACTPFVSQAAFPESFDLGDADVGFFGQNEFDQSGYRVVGVGDVNGDHTDDILITAPGAFNWSGAVYLVLGKTSGMEPLMSLEQADVAWVGEAEGDQAGVGACALGDFNGDGLADFAVGAPFAGDEYGQGKAYVILGRTGGWSAQNSLADADIMLVGEAGMALTGFSLAGTEDLNGDGFDDLAVGAHGTGSSTGKVFVVLGGASGQFGSVESLAAFPSFAGEAAGDSAGFSVAGVGDTNGDGFGDLLIGAYGNSEAASKAGKAYLVLGHAGTWSSDYPLSQADVVFLGQSAKDYAGYAVAPAGDLDADGLADFVIGAPGRDDNGEAAGMAAVVYGKTSFGSAYDLGQADVRLQGAASGDAAGSSISSAGDVDGDGFSDLLIAAPTSDFSDTDAGAVYLVRGGPRFLGEENLDGATTLFAGEAALDQAGWSVSSGGDVDGDGFSDIVVSAYGSDYNGAGSGMTYLIFSGPRVDIDGDGFSEAMGDCNDYNAAQNPGMAEIPNNGIDDDCRYGDARTLRFIRGW